MTRGEALQVFDGTMLGDGGLKKLKKGANFGMAFSKSLVPQKEITELTRRLSLEEHIKYERWLSKNVFEVLGIPLSEGYPKILATVSKGKPVRKACLQTRQSPLLGSQFDEWYIGGEWSDSMNYGKYIHGALKIVPHRIMQTSVLPALTLAHWFLQDGGSSWCRSGETLSYPRITISSDGFAVEEVLHLTAMLNTMGINTIGYGHQKCIKGSGLKIYLSSAGNNIDHFMDIIEPHVLEIFGDSRSPSYKDIMKRKTSSRQVEIEGRMSKITG